MTRTSLLSLAALTLATAVFFIGLGSYGLVEPSDARYAEIAREMHESGDFLYPRLMGIHHFDKPPLIYWLTSLGYAVFGVNEWGARVVQGVLGLALAGILLGFARRHLSREQAPWVVVLLVTTPAVIGASRMLTTDLLLVTCQILVLVSWFDHFTGGGNRFTLIWMYLGLGLALLTKGPVGALIPALILAPTAFLCRGHGARGISFRVLPGILITAAAAVPWTWLVLRDTPGLFDYLVKEQLAGRATAGGLGHPRPWHFFLVVFPALGLPWLLLLPAGWRRLRREAPPLGTFLLLWALVPPLCFSLPTTKLPLYVLTSYPAVALLATAALTAKVPPRRTIRAVAVGFTLLGLGLLTLATGRIDLPKGDLTGLSAADTPMLLLPLCGALIAAGIAAFILTRPKRASCRGAALALALGLAFLPAFASTRGDDLPLRSVRVLCGDVEREIRDDDLLVEYRDFAAGLTFYTGRVPILAGIERELRFESHETRARVIDLDRFDRLWEGPRRMLVLTRNRHVDELRGARVIRSAGGYSLLTNR